VARIVFTEELIATFYEKIKVQYPELPLATIDKIVRAEFRMAKQVMTSGTLEDIRLQYLFKLTVSPQRIMKQLRFMYSLKHRISEDAYRHYEIIILNHIKNNKNKFNKIKKLKEYEQKIKKYTGYTREQISRGEYLDNGHNCNA